MLDKFSLADRRHRPWGTEEEAFAKLPEQLRPFWGEPVFHPEPSAWHSKKRQRTSNRQTLATTDQRSLGGPVMKTGQVQDPGDGAEPYLEIDCWTPWQYHVPEEELEPYYRDANALMMKLERMPPAVRARLKQIEIRCPVKGCLLATVYWIPRRPTTEELEHERRINRQRGATGLASKPQASQPSYCLYVGRTTGGTQVYNLVDHRFDHRSGLTAASFTGGPGAATAPPCLTTLTSTTCSASPGGGIISGRPRRRRSRSSRSICGPSGASATSTPSHRRGVPRSGELVQYHRPSEVKKAHPCCVKVCEGSSRKARSRICMSRISGIPAAAARSWVPGSTLEGVREHASHQFPGLQPAH